MGYTARHHTGVTRLQNAVASHRSCIFCCKIRVRVTLFYAILNLTFLLGGFIQPSWLMGYLCLSLREFDREEAARTSTQGRSGTHLRINAEVARTFA